jgi:ABC-2 type transport system ATP-binding protein
MMAEVSMNDPIRLSGVNKVYPGGIVAVRHCTLRVPAGQTIAVLGPNGAGKTTMIRMILGLARPSGGEVRVFGRDPRDADARVRVGTMLQIAEMPASLTVREHITLFSSYYPRPFAIEETLRLADLESLANRRSERLSGGQRQRLAFALAICGDPDLLVLDEPTASLDIESRVALWEQIRILKNRGNTIVFTTHQLHEADALADRIALISRGSIVADGTPDAIKARAGTAELEAAYLALTKVATEAMS